MGSFLIHLVAISIAVVFLSYVYLLGFMFSQPMYSTEYLADRVDEHNMDIEFLKGKVESFSRLKEDVELIMCHLDKVLEKLEALDNSTQSSYVNMIKKLFV
jgi:hypothetical protein